METTSLNSEQKQWLLQMSLNHSWCEIHAGSAAIVNRIFQRGRS